QSTIIVAHPTQAGDDLTGFSSGPKAQIHAKQIAFVRHLRERVSDILSQLAKIAGVRQSRTSTSTGRSLRCPPLRSADVDKVHIGAEIKFSTAQFSHSEHRKAACGKTIA